jgi:hypothetical protein
VLSPGPDPDPDAGLPSSRLPIQGSDGCVSYSVLSAPPCSRHSV